MFGLSSIAFLYSGNKKSNQPPVRKIQPDVQHLMKRNFLKNKFPPVLRYFICLLFPLFSLTVTQAQDLHFSQFFAAPLSTNPSNTGFYNGTWRVGGNFKSQWPWAIRSTTFNYRTFAAYADFAFLKTVKGNNWMGAGLVMMNDVTGDGQLSTNKILASVAFHQTFGTFQKWVLSVGAGGGIVFKKIDYTRLYFNDQWDPNGLLFNQSINTNEPVNDNRLSYLDLSAGAHVTYFHNDLINVSGGIAFFHLNKPSESFSARDNRLGIRPVVSAVAFTKLSKQIHLEPGFLFMYQKKAQEYILNLLTGFTIISDSKAKNSIVFIGTAFRPKDAWIPLVGYQYKTMRVILNYDVNLSSLNNASRGNGGFEMSVVYTGGVDHKSKRMVPCPRL